MRHSPYEGLDARAYWRTGVAQAHIAQAPEMDLYRPKFKIRASDRVFTAGSCFAQHIARNMRKWGMSVIDREPAPLGLPPERHSDYGYGLYSARHGNIYTTRQFLQLTQEACGRFAPKNWIWERDGRFFDALRPSVDPNGLESPDLVKRSRQTHLKKFRQALGEASLVVFTLGLTETWEDIESGTVFPTAPGTISGRYDPDHIRFLNLTHKDVLQDFLETRRLIKRFNPSVRFLLTVSPVPLTATASGRHVMVASSYSKSVLRGVVGQLTDAYSDIDYFPSYEIITAPSARGFFYAPNMRDVLPEAVETVMKTFLAAHGDTILQPENRECAAGSGQTSDDIRCEELLLEAFAQ